MFLGMNNAGGGIGSQVDGLADSITKIESSLGHIDKLLGSISTKAGKVKLGDAAKVGMGATSSSFGALPTASSSSLGLGGFSTEHSGFGPLGLAGFNHLSPAQGGFNQNIGAGQGSALQNLAGKGRGGTAAAVGIVGGLSAASGMWNALPNVTEAVDQRQTMYGATIAMGSSMPDFHGLKTQMMGAFGGYATSTTSQEHVFSKMADYGMVGDSNTISAGSRSFMRQTSNISLLTGTSQEEAAGLGFRSADPRVSNNLLSMGIRGANHDGSPADLQKVANQIATRTYGKGFTTKQIERGSQQDGFLRRNLQAAGYNDDQTDQMLKIIRAQASNGGKQLDQNQLDKITKNDKRDPMAAYAKHEGTRSQTISDYSDNLIAGWDKALKAAEAVEKSMQHLQGVLGPMANAKGFGTTFGSTHAGNAFVGAADHMKDGLGAILGMRLGRRLLRGVAGKAGGGLLNDVLGGEGGGSILSGGRGLFGRLLGGGAEGAAAAEGGTAIGGATVAEGGAAAGGVALGIPAAVAGAALVAQHAAVKGYDAVGHAVGTDSHSSTGHRVMSSLLHAGAQATTGMNPIGAARGLLSQGWNYGDKDQYNDRSSLGEAGHFVKTLFGGGGGAAAVDANGSSTKATSTTTGTAKGGAAAKKGVGGGTNSAVAYAMAQVAHPTQNWYHRCDNFVGHCYGRSASGYNTAYEHWQSIPEKLKHHDMNAPAGAMVFWFMGEGRPGHIALGVGGGKVASSDIPSHGLVGVIGISELTTKWGCKYLGWTPPYFDGKVVAGGADTSDMSAGDMADTSGDPADQTTSTPSASVDSSFGAMSANSSIFADANGSITSSAYSIAGMVGTSTLGEIGKGPVVTSGTAGSDGKTASQNEGDASTNGAADTSGAAGNASSAPGKGSGVARWSNVAAAAAKAAGLNSKWLPLLMQRMQVESGGDPNAINNWDSNARAGHPSEGLMQVIQPTFSAYAGSYASRGLKDPFANIYAAIKYSLATYGEKGLAKAWGGNQGYSNGAWEISKDEVNKLHRGEMVLPAVVAEQVRTALREGNAGQGISKATGGKLSSGGGKQTVNLNITIQSSGEPKYDAGQLARELKKVLDAEYETSVIGGL